MFAPIESGSTASACPIGPPTGPAAPAPFEELTRWLEPVRFEEAVSDLYDRGFISIPLSQATRDDLMNRVREADRHGWTRRGGIEVVDLTDEPFTETLGAFAEALVERIGPQRGWRQPLVPHECELRRPTKGVADGWHVDRSPNLLTFLVTLKGEPTQYVTPEVGAAFTTGPANTASRVPPSRLKASDILGFPSGEGLELQILVSSALQTDAPTLVHRAPPPSEGRTIFISRWKPRPVPAQPSADYPRVTYDDPAPFGGPTPASPPPVSSREATLRARLATRPDPAS